eukprot:TRINITY_DN76_c0_g2_i1.p1 TRINITY_DN76_c0_g2~~TRINITY_DN76_c0_g2_i1.p1  ORF type:complete len:753 (+),score=-124.51 TRINITY_DN76_c0_g2_i1:120-2261(+)
MVLSQARVALSVAVVAFVIAVQGDVAHHKKLFSDPWENGFSFSSSSSPSCNSLFSSSPCISLSSSLPTTTSTALPHRPSLPTFDFLRGEKGREMGFGYHSSAEDYESFEFASRFSSSRKEKLTLSVTGRVLFVALILIAFSRSSSLPTTREKDGNYSVFRFSLPRVNVWRFARLAFVASLFLSGAAASRLGNSFSAVEALRETSAELKRRKELDLRIGGGGKASVKGLAGREVAESVSNALSESRIVRVMLRIILSICVGWVADALWVGKYVFCAQLSVQWVKAGKGRRGSNEMNWPQLVVVVAGLWLCFYVQGVAAMPFDPPVFERCMSIPCLGASLLIGIMGRTTCVYSRNDRAHSPYGPFVDLRSDTRPMHVYIPGQGDNHLSGFLNSFYLKIEEVGALLKVSVCRIRGCDRGDCTPHFIHYIPGPAFSFSILNSNPIYFVNGISAWRGINSALHFLNLRRQGQEYTFRQDLSSPEHWDVSYFWGYMTTVQRLSERLAAPIEMIFCPTGVDDFIPHPVYFEKHSRFVRSLRTIFADTSKHTQSFSAIGHSFGCHLLRLALDPEFDESSLLLNDVVSKMDVTGVAGIEFIPRSFARSVVNIFDMSDPIATCYQSNGEGCHQIVQEILKNFPAKRYCEINCYSLWMHLQPNARTPNYYSLSTIDRRDITFLVYFVRRGGHGLDSFLDDTVYTRTHFAIGCVILLLLQNSLRY